MATEMQIDVAKKLGFRQTTYLLGIKEQCATQWGVLTHKSWCVEEVSRIARKGRLALIGRSNGHAALMVKF
jgi:hypothetical protein